MSYSGEAAEQVVRMSLEGTEVALKLAGTGAKELAVLLYAVLKDQKKTKGKIRLSNMLRSGKELKVFAIRDDELAKFSQEAKRYGVLYTVVKDRDHQDGYTDVFVRAEDASKVNRIFERFKLATVDMGSVKTDIEKDKADRAQEKEDMERPMRESSETVKGDTEGVVSEKDKVDEFLDALLGAQTAKENEHQGNPTQDRTQRSRQSGPSSEKKPTSERDAGERTNSNRPSVRKEMNDIRNEQKANLQKEQVRRSQEHKAPRKKRRKRKEVRS